MLRRLLLLTSIVFLLGCTPEVEESIIEEATLPLSKITLNSNGESLYDLSYSAYELLPSTSCAKEDYPNFIFYKPGIFLPNELIYPSEDLDFYFFFYDVEMEYTGEPFLDEFWAYLQNNPAELNKAPFKRNFFLKVKKGGKVYRNSWKGDPNVANKEHRGYDETGLEVKNSSITRFDDFNDLNKWSGYPFSVVRIKGQIEGALVTEDGENTLEVDGELDLFVHIF